MDRWATEDPSTKALKDEPSAMLSYLAEKGFEHEDTFLETLRKEYRNVVVIDADVATKEEQVTNTLHTMHAGADVIFQARLTHGDFAGYAGFLVKVSTPSKFGAYSYEPWDTKLSRQPKAYFIIQPGCYAEMLKAVQETLPGNLTVVLGTQERASYRTQDFYAYHQRIKSDFTEMQSNFEASKQPYPFATTDVGDWSTYVDTLREQQDHLSKIANITRNQISKLDTMRAMMSCIGRPFLNCSLSVNYLKYNTPSSSISS